MSAFFRQVEDMNRGQWLHQGTIAGQHAVIAERGERVTEGFSAGSVIDYIDSFATGEPQRLPGKFPGAGDNHFVGAGRPGDLYLAAGLDTRPITLPPRSLII